jgi:hypothetical protein
MTSAPLIPVLVIIDVEPDGFFVDRSKKPDWSGFERALTAMADIRAMLAARTTRTANFIWLVRADAQVAETYGDADWGLAHYRPQLQALAAAEDEIGLHVHAYHWNPDRRRWVEDYGNQSWVDHCIELGVDAFERSFRQRPRSFSMGLDWTSEATVETLRRLRIRYDFCTVIAKEPERFPSLGAYTGATPDCTRIPHGPYHPARGDFLSPSAQREEDGIWIIPQSSRCAANERSRKQILADLVRWRPVPPTRTRKFFLQDAPAEMRAGIDHALDVMRLPYLTFTVRTHEFNRPEVVDVIRGNLEDLLEQREAARFAFTTPPRALQLLGYAA